jgi:hypothetical protein
MGCLNSGQGFDHWFANIHLSGPCNRSCYFCIGQWMPGQDMNNNLDSVLPLRGYDEFLSECRARNITEVNITGTNTDPLLFENLELLINQLAYDGFTNIGMRTNAVKTDRLLNVIALLDKFSISVTSFDPELYAKTMGQGEPPTMDQMEQIVKRAGITKTAVKLNAVLCPETVIFNEVFDTVMTAGKLGIPKVNLREPYGQAHIGNPMAASFFGEPDKLVFGNPCYIVSYPDYGNVEVTYWDVHYTEVESVNLYADGKVSLDYPISRGHSDTLGEVHGQRHFKRGRQAPQWVGTKSEKRIT